MMKKLSCWNANEKCKWNNSATLPPITDKHCSGLFNLFSKLVLLIKKREKMAPVSRTPLPHSTPYTFSLGFIMSAALNFQWLPCCKGQEVQKCSLHMTEGCCDERLHFLHRPYRGLTIALCRAYWRNKH